jgi:cytosine/adenosine deaminase-related metal-dependent hydrolase
VPTGIKVFRKIALLATLSEELGEIRDAAIVIKGNEIVYVGSDGEVPTELLANGDQTIDLSNHLVLPGVRC